MKIRKYYRTGFQKDVTRGTPRGLAIAQTLANGEIALGFSLCSDVDTFDPHKCNLIAEGRLASMKFIVSQPNEIPDVVDSAFSEMYDDLIWVAQEAVTRQNKVVNRK